MIIEVGAVTAAVGVVWDIVADPAKDILKKTAGKLVGDKVDGAVRDLKRRLVHELPKNHDLVRGLREAYLRALQEVLTCYKAELGSLPAHEQVRLADDAAFADRLQDWLDRRLRPGGGKGIDFHEVTEDDVASVLDATIHPSATEGFGRLAEARGLAEREALAEVQGVWGNTAEIPARFLAHFHGRGETGWYELFALHVSETLKTNERFRSIFVAAELVDIKVLLGERFDRTDASLAELKVMVAGLAARSGVPPAALQAQLARLGEIDVPAEQIPAKLETFVTEFLKLKEDLARKTNADPEVAEARAQALALLNAGDLDGARAAFVAMRTRVRERRQESARDEATLLADEAKVDRLQVRYADAAAAYEQAAELVSFDAEAAYGYLTQLVSVLIDHGNEFGDNALLRRAIDLARQRIHPLVPRDTSPLEWAATQNNLGSALQTLGSRESGTARLEAAVTAYRWALEERTRARAPLDWAATQNNLGNALWTLGGRESGTARLEEAVTAYRSALEELTRARVPLDWAMTQNNLGTALSTLGERESGTARLEEAVTAYRSALEERTRARVPLNWAATQNNLGTALSTLGERESGTARLEEAVTAHRSALEERTRARVPLDWAMTQNNLGHALWTLGGRESGTVRLEEAVTAFRLALEELTRARVPFSWALTQSNLGEALATLGERQGGTKCFEQAVTACQLALEELTEEHAPFHRRMAQDNLDKALALLAKHR
jgi:tetratricopeptide (TPR) repeat protein